jgi:penicillin G amidase
MKSRRGGSALVAGLAALLSACGALLTRPQVATSVERQAELQTRGLPLSRPVQVRFGPHRIPFVEGETDADVAFALGLLHAHLRLGQMELMRRMASGRLAEVAGPFARSLDRAVRTLDLGRAVPALRQKLPPATLEWLTRFVEGVNWQQTHAPTLPLEYRALALEREPWTVDDVLLIGRLGAADLSWLYYFQAFQLQRLPGGPALLARIQGLSRESLPSFETQTGALEQLLGGASRSGSNSLVVSSGRSATGTALIANDPHLGLFAPNFWLILGYRSPSYEVVGLSIPGLPFVAVGRNREVGWGGTNLRGISSHLYRLSPAEVAQVRERPLQIPVRGWLTATPNARDSPWGPIVSDLDPIAAATNDVVALQWVGHQPSDEISAFLAANRATDWGSFRQAFADYAVSAQNMLYADRQGNIGQLLAYKQPLLRHPEQTLELVKDTSNPIIGYRAPLELPQAYNPGLGYIASANNQPARTEPPLAFTYADNNRMRRMAQILANTEKVTLEDLKRVQGDVLSLTSLELRDALVRRCPNPALTSTPSTLLWDSLRAWDGRYDRAARGPVAFQVLFAHLAPLLLAQAWQERDLVDFIIRGDYWRPLVLERLNTEDASGAASICSAVATALTTAGDDFLNFENWGEQHKLELGPPLARAPLIGRRFRVASVPSSGSSDTLLKAAHGLSSGKNPVTFGACARHLSDMGDPDKNYFVLLGGEDGWLNGPYLDDQVPLWQAGQYIQVPLTPTAVHNWALQTVLLEPAAGR